MSPALLPPPKGDAARQLPIILRAKALSGRPDLETVAEGDAEFRRGGAVIRADRLAYEYANDRALAKGNVRVSKDGNVYTGPELQLEVERFEGFFLNPTYHFGRTGAGGAARRIDFIDDQRAVATEATYTSCPSDGSGDPAWLLSTERVHMDFGTNEGVAENAVLRFYGVPILGAPRLSFPLTDERKSGWLPPSFNLDSKSGFQVTVPYYWNIAPNRDATFTPSVSTRRGLGIESQIRYLEPSYNGAWTLNLIPHDNLTSSRRYALNAQHESELPGNALLQLHILRVSDDDYWKDFQRDVVSPTPRMFASDITLDKPLGNWSLYSRVQRWQIQQTVDAASRIEAPYERVPQVGARYASRFGSGFDVGFETELNRFANPANGISVARPTGVRFHALGSIARPFVQPGWTLTPKVSFNAASYSLDGSSLDALGNSTGTGSSTTPAYRRSASRVIPSVSLDSAWVFERDARWFGKSVRQTLEPRLLYVNTPYRNQSNLPNFDSANKDFNFDAIFSENAFSGVDRVSDGQQVTAGVITRFIDPESGAESLRLGIAQRYLFRDQRVTLTPDGKSDAPIQQRLSDLLLLASTTLVPSWNLDASVQYSPDTDRTIRSIVGARYSPGPFRTLSLTYRLSRGLSEQLELGWQWPIYGPTPEQKPSLRTEGGGSCTGSWYGVGRVNYSTRDSRLTDSIFGVEYDAGCWIGRVVAERLSTGRSEATTRLLLQLELVGLSRLGSNPLQVLKDNIPGYRLLRDDRNTVQPTATYD
ncbi:LPS-assembly protein LptD [soil metagenome]